VQTRRLQESYGGSNSSLAYSSGELSRVIASSVAASGRLMHFLILEVKWGFWAITLVPDLLEGQSRVLSIDAGDQFPKKVWAKILAHWIGVQGQSKLVKNPKTPPLCELLPGEPLTQIKKVIFLIEPRRLSASVEGLNTSLAAAAGELWPKMFRSLKWLAWALKGLRVEVIIESFLISDYHH